MTIELKEIRFSYGRTRALDGVSFSLDGGAVGLLGPNGAGKSTLLKIMLGFLHPDAGDGRVLGFDIRREQKKIRRAVGYMPESDCLIAGMDGVTFTSFFGELSGMPKQEAMKRAHDVLFYAGLGEARYRLLETYSAGMKQRLKLAQALVHDPKLLFLDEPTSNLDPQGRTEILDLIKDISSHKDIQVLLCSHILTDIESVCSNVIILNKGRLAAQGKISELRQTNFRLYEMRIKGGEREEAFLGRLRELGCRIEETEERMLKVFMPPQRDFKDVFRMAVAENVQIRHLVRSQTSLEDLFAKAVGVD